MPDPQQKKSSDLSLRTVIAASIAGALATAAVSTAGIAGTLLGGAVFPVLLILGREMVLQAADRAPVVNPRSSSPSHAETADGDAYPSEKAAAAPDAPLPPPSRESMLQRIRWRRVAITGGAAVALVVAIFTLSDLVLGESPVADRGSTFFARPAATEPAPLTDPDEQPAPTIPEHRESPPPTDPTPTEEAPEEAPTEPAEESPATEPAPEESPVVPEEPAPDEGPEPTSERSPPTGSTVPSEVIPLP